MNRLVACPSCQRHLRASETSCPFCRADVAAFIARTPARVLPTERLSRALLVTFAAASVGAAGCGGDTEGGKKLPLGDAGVDSGSGGDIGAPAYGVPVYTGGATGAGGEVNAPLYGLPVYTGGTTGAGGDDGTGGDVGGPEYGAPPPPEG